MSIKGKDYFVGNSCCPSTSANEGGVCGAACTAGTMGIPETKWDGSWSCCGFDSHVCPVTGSGLADKPQTKCCPLTDEAYWNYQSQSAECCPNSFGENTLNNVYNVKGKTGVWHCCPSSEKAYWNGSTVGCCSGSLYVSAYREGLEVYNCCDTTDGFYAVAEVMGSSQSGIGNLETCCSTSVYGQNPSAYWDGNKAQCCSGTVYKDVNGYRCCPSDSVVTDVVGATDGLQTCCAVSAYGNEPSAWWYEAPNELFDSYAVCCQTGVEATPYGCCDLKTMANNKDLCRACGYSWEKSAVYYLSGETCDRTNYQCGGNQYCQDRYGSGSEWCSLGGLTCNMDAWGCFVEGQTMCSTPAGCSLAKEPCTTE